ncbi:MAG: hypothetical protein Q8914_04550 [Bacteroidota bacterium]|nr:hypothetical protein [Bacteroidota bacterium]
MNKKISLSLLLTSVLLLTSCSGKFAPTSDYFNVTPQVLVLQGGKVPATIDGTFPAKSFPAKAIVTITPVLKYDGGEALGTPLTLQGSKVKANNKVIGKEGGSFSLSTVYDYIPAMSKSELYLRFTTKLGKKSIAIPDIKVADGVIATEALADAASATPAIAADKFQRVIQEAHEASILFLIEQAKIRENQLKMAPVQDLNSKIAETGKDTSKQISSIELSSYASPDGPLTLNEKLAGSREKATIGYLKNTLKKAKATGAIDAKFTAEDWEGFQQLVSASNIQDKELILRVLSMYSDPEKRETEIKNLSSVYKNLAEEILPQLRRSKMKLTVDIIGKSDDQLKNFAQNDPSKLNVDEMLYTATLPGTDKEAIYKKTAELFPNDYRAYNNLGVLAFKAGNISTAKSYFEKASQLNNSAEVNSNLALVAMTTGADAATVNAYLGKAAGSEGLKEAQGIAYIKQGEYTKAVQSFGDLKTNNAALAQLLAKDYSKAKATLDAVPQPNAETNYLKALVGARTNNKDLVVSGLKAAVSANKAYAKKALNDVEFSKYVLDASVASILK